MTSRPCAGRRARWGARSPRGANGTRSAGCATRTDEPLAGAVHAEVGRMDAESGAVRALVLHQDDRSARLAVLTGPGLEREDGDRAADRLAAAVHRLQDRRLALTAAHHGAQGRSEPLGPEPDVEPEEMLVERLLLAHAPQILGLAVPHLHPPAPVDDGDRHAE